MDIIFIGLTVVLFGTTLALMHLCERV